MSRTYQVDLQKDFLIFSAAHFITFNGNICERLHGHNYKVAATVRAPLDENHYVIDFIALRDELKTIVDRLDHRMLLPDRHEAIHVSTGEKETEVRFEDRRWVFPTGDCIVLPVANTTAELLAGYLGEQLLPALEERTGVRPTYLKIGVDENNGQWGVCELIDE